MSLARYVTERQVITVEECACYALPELQGIYGILGRSVQAALPAATNRTGDGPGLCGYRGVPPTTKFLPAITA